MPPNKQHAQNVTEIGHFPNNMVPSYGALPYSFTEKIPKFASPSQFNQMFKDLFRSDIGVIPFLHGFLLLGSVQLVMTLMGAEGLSSATLLRWDAVHYDAIRDHGYLGESSAFFPLFPYLWRSLGLSPFGMAMLNGAIYLLATRSLVMELVVRPRHQLAFAVLPSMLFLFAPYTEALFFLFSVMFLVGIKRGSLPLSALGLFACTLTRPAFTALVPAIIIMVFLTSSAPRVRWITILTHLAAAALGLLAVMLFQFQQTGELFGFYAAQGSYGNTFKIPALPLGSWGGGDVVRLDASALLLGSTCAAFLLYEIREKFKAPSRSTPPIVLVSAGYIAGVSAIALFLRNGELYSLNRFVYATPFTLVVIHAFLSKLPRLRVKAWMGVLALLLGASFFFGSFVHIRTFLLFTSVSILIVVGVFSLSDDTRLSRVLYWPWIVVMFSLQVYFFTRFLRGEWVA